MIIPLSLVSLTLFVEALGIVGGAPVPNYRFHVTVRTEFLPSCGGTIFASNIVLTAAHCLFDFNDRKWFHEDDIKVLNSDYSDRFWLVHANWYSCDQYQVHHKYDPYLFHGMSEADLAVIKLDRPFEFNQSFNNFPKLCHDSSTHLEGFAYGMGLTGRNPDIPADVLMGVTLYKYFSCAVSVRPSTEGLWAIDESKQICFGSRTSQAAGTCKGDSGSPLVAVTSSSDVMCLIGIASFNLRSCDNPRIPGVFTRVDYYQGWIETTIEAMSSERRESCCVFN